MEELKTIVKEKYGQIASQSHPAASSCCGGGCGSGGVLDTVDYTTMAEDYAHLAGYVQEADLGLGCGLPTEFAKIKPGDTVVDLGAGAGNDCFVARAETGDTGRVIGVDFTPQMLDKARQNAAKLGYTNVEFVQGDIEAIPLPDAVADVVVSNCVFNLVPDKAKAFAETHRILKPGGHFSVSDIVVEGELPTGLRDDAAMYAGCVSGALLRDEYLDIIRQAGFRNLVVQKQRAIELPTSILEKYLDTAQIEAFKQGQGIIYSINVYAEK